MVKARIRGWGMHYVSEDPPIEVQTCVCVCVCARTEDTVCWHAKLWVLMQDTGCLVHNSRSQKTLYTSLNNKNVTVVYFDHMFFLLVLNLPNVSVWVRVPLGLSCGYTVGLSPLLSVQWAGPSQAAGGGGGHRGLAEESGLLGPGESWRSGPFLHQRGRRQRLRPARGAQLPRPGGELPHDHLLASCGDRREEQQYWQKSQTQWKYTHVLWCEILNIIRIFSSALKSSLANFIRVVECEVTGGCFLLPRHHLI